MTTDDNYDYRNLAKRIAETDGMGNLLPVVEKELLHYRILEAMREGGHLGQIVFQGGTSLRLCYGAPRYSEDLDFAGGSGFSAQDLQGLKQCVEQSLSRMSPDLQVRVKEPNKDTGLVKKWRIVIRTAGMRKDLPSQSIKLEVAAIPAYEPTVRPARINYNAIEGLFDPILMNVETPTEIMADKMLSFACASHLRMRDLWDIHWLNGNTSVDPKRAAELAGVKADDYGEASEWKDRASRVDGVRGVVNSPDFLNEARRFLPDAVARRTVLDDRWRTVLADELVWLYSL